MGKTGKENEFSENSFSEKKFYGMRNDYMFRAVLQESEVVLRNLLSVLLGMEESEIVSCRIENPIELGKTIEDKDCVLDIKLTLNGGKIINIEVQNTDEHNWPERSLLYWSRAYDNLKQGQDYSELLPTCHIGILNFTLFPEAPQFYSEYRILNTENHYCYTDKFCIRVLDLTQIENGGDANPRLLKWARIFLAKTIEELEQLAGREEALQEMILELKKLSEEEKIRMACEAREDYERRMLTQYRAGERAGREEGIEEGMRKGKAEGIAEGIAQGITKGQEETLKVLNWLQENGRHDDLQKVLQDKEYLEKVLGEYNALGNQKQLKPGHGRTSGYN